MKKFAEELYPDYKTFSDEEVSESQKKEIYDFSKNNYPEFVLGSSDNKEEFLPKLSYDNIKLNLKNLNPDIAEKLVYNNDGTISLNASEFYSSFEELPEWYWYKWWVARLLLEMNLWITKKWEPRDLDLVRYVENEPKEWLDNELSMKYMPDDFEHWYWIEVVWDDYFDSRDFTINEVIYKNWTLTFSEICLNDILNNTIRPSENKFNEDYWKFPFDILMKSLRFYVRMVEEKWNAKLEIENINQLYDNYVNYFRVALNLDRAVWSSIFQWNMLLDELIKYWKFPRYINNPKEARKYIDYLWEAVWYNYDNIEGTLFPDDIEEKSRNTYYANYKNIVPKYTEEQKKDFYLDPEEDLAENLESLWYDFEQSYKKSRK